MAKCHAKIWQILKNGRIFEMVNDHVSCPNMAIWKSVCISETAAHRAKISSISNPWGRKSVCAASGMFADGQVSSQIWQFWREAHISEIIIRRAKIMSFQSPEVERGYMQLREQPLCASFPLLCQNGHADLEFACKFCFPVYKQKKKKNSILCNGSGLMIH